MKIIFANKYYYMKGGAERYMFDLQSELANHGHDIIPFAMKGDKNGTSEWSKYFVSAVKTDSVRFGYQGLRTAGRMLYSFEARRKFGKLLDAVDPGLIHLHNIYHQISPSILPEAVRRGVPVVMTAHDYNLISPNYSLFHNGEIWEPEAPGMFTGALKKKVVKGSFAATALTLSAMRLHAALHLWDGVDKIIAPSRFMEAMLHRNGIPARKIVHVPHFIDTSNWEPKYSDGYYALFVGRLSEEKGVDVLIRAAARLPHVAVRIVGSGPQESELKALARELGADNVHFDGWKSGADLRKIYEDARFLVVPSVWFEVFGLIALEAYASGKPVIASQMGGLAEVVTDESTGHLVSAGDVDELEQVMEDLWRHPDVCVQMGRNGREWVEQDFTPEKHYEKIMHVYKEVIEE